VAQLGEPEIDCPLQCGLSLRVPVVMHTWPSSDRTALVDVSLDSEVWELAWADHLSERHPIEEAAGGRS
jgi:hypothetical protein